MWPASAGMCLRANREEFAEDKSDDGEKAIR